MYNVEERSCPLNLDLTDYTLGLLGQEDAGLIREHLGICDTCEQAVRHLRNSLVTARTERTDVSASVVVPEDIQRQSREHATRVRSLLGLPQPSARGLGQLWTMSSISQVGRTKSSTARIVVVLWAETQSNSTGVRSLVVGPISLATDYRADRDLMVFEQESPLGYEFMVEAWNEIAITDSQLGRYIGSLPQAVERDLALLYQVHLGQEVDTTPIAVRVGPAILDRNDPRVAFQRHEIRLCDHLRTPALVAVASAPSKADDAINTLGDLVSAFSNELADIVPASSLAELEADLTSIAVLRDPKGRNGGLKAAMERAALSDAAPATRSAFITRIVSFLADLTPKQDRGGRTVYARTQRGRRAP